METKTLFRMILLALISVTVCSCNDRFVSAGIDAKGVEYGFIDDQLVTVTPAVTRAPARSVTSKASNIELGSLFSLPLGTWARIGGAVLLGVVLLCFGFMLISHADKIIGRWLDHKRIEQMRVTEHQREANRRAKRAEKEARSDNWQSILEQAADASIELYRTTGKRTRLAGWRGWAIMWCILEKNHGYCQVRAVRKLAAAWFKVPYRFTEEWLRAARYLPQNQYPRFDLPPNPTEWVCVRDTIKRKFPGLVDELRYLPGGSPTWKMIPIDELPEAERQLSKSKHHLKSDDPQRVADVSRLHRTISAI